MDEEEVEKKPEDKKPTFSFSVNFTGVAAITIAYLLGKRNGEKAGREGLLRELKILNRGVK